MKSASRKYEGILLDIGCGGNKRDPNWVGMDKRKLPGVDIVHDLEVFPWPIKSETAITVAASHVLEHIKPWCQLDLFNEVWRILKPHGQFVIAVPYGVNHGFVQDPTLCKPFNETTFMYFDPEPPNMPKGTRNILYHIYEPKPWRIQFWHWQAEGQMEVILQKRSDYVRNKV